MNWYRSLGENGRRTFWACFAGFAMDSMDSQLYAFVAPSLIFLWSLTHAQAGVLATAALLASSVGGWVAGILADRIGRVRTLQLTILWFAVTTALSGLTNSFDQLLWVRALQGFGFGGEWAAGSILIAEVAPALYRGRAGGMVQGAWSVGWGIAVLVSTVMFLALPMAWAWRAVFIAGLLPGLVIFLARRRVEEPALFQASAGGARWGGIFSSRGIKSTVIGALLAMGIHSGYYAVATWLPTFLRTERDLSVLNTGGYLAVIISGSWCGYVTGAYLSDLLGRRLTFLLFAAASLIIAFTYTWMPISNAVMLVLGFPLGFCASGIYSGIGPVLSELFPTELRGAGQGFCYNLGRGVAGLFPTFVGSTADAIGLQHAIGLYASIGYGLVMVTALVMPETRGSELTGMERPDAALAGVARIS